MKPGSNAAISVVFGIQIKQSLKRHSRGRAAHMTCSSTAIPQVSLGNPVLVGHTSTLTKLVMNLIRRQVPVTHSKASISTPLSSYDGFKDISTEYCLIDVMTLSHQTGKQKGVE